MKKTFLLLGIALILGGISFLPAGADAMAVAPPIIDDIEADPGDIIIRDFKVINESSDSGPKTFYFTAQNFVADQNRETGSQEFLEQEELTGLASWIHPTVDSVTVDERSEKEVRVVINIPENAEPGGHYAVLWAGEAKPDEAGNTVGLTGNVGVLFLVRVSGEVRESASIVEFNYLKKFQTRLPVEFYTRFQNMGTVHFKPRGTIKITGLFGREIATIEANPKESNVLPESIRKIDAIWINNTVEEGLGQFDEKNKQDAGYFNAVKNEWKNFAFGPYKARLSMIYGSQKQVLTTDTKTFWVFPWHLLLTILVLIIIAVILIKIYNKTIIKHSQKKKK